MKSISSLFHIVFFMFILSSCTITKRHFGSGYHIEWKTKEREDAGFAKVWFTGSDTLCVKKEEFPESALEQKNISNITLESEAWMRKGSEIPIKEQLIPVGGKHLQNEFREEFIPVKRPIHEKVKIVAENRDYPDDYETKKRVEPLTWVAFSVFLLAIAMFLLPLQFAVANASVLGLIFALLIIGAAVTALVSWLHIKKNPSRYKGKTFTGIVLFFCSAGVGLAVLSLIGFLRNLF